MGAFVMVFPVVVDEVIDWLGVWVQFLVTDEVRLPEFTSPRMAEMSDSGSWPASTPALTGMSLLHAWSGIWLPLAFSRLSLLKPDVGPLNVAALATGADTPTSAAVATASAKARFLRDMFVFPQRSFTDSARGVRVTVCVQTVTLHDRA